MREIISSTLRYCAYLGCFSIVLMAVNITLDVCGRFFLNIPLPGGPEMVEQLMVCVIYLFLPYVTDKKMHISADVFVSFLSAKVPRIHLFIGFSWEIIAIFILAMLAWQGFLGGLDALKSGEATGTLYIPQFPFRFILAVGFFLSFFTAFVNFIVERKGTKII